MKINAKLEIASADILCETHGINIGGYVQRYIDNEVIKHMSKYVPMKTGTLRNSATIHSVIGSGKIVQDTPYARYLYYGEVYGTNHPIIRGGVLEGWYSDKVKHPTGRKLKYDKSKNPNATDHWFEVMKLNHKQEILDGVNELIRRS